MRLNDRLRSTFMDAVRSAIPENMPYPVNPTALVNRIRDNYQAQLPATVRDVLREYPGAVRTDGVNPLRGHYGLSFSTVNGFSWRPAMMNSDPALLSDYEEMQAWQGSNDKYHQRRHRVLRRIQAVVSMSTTVAQLHARLPQFAHLLPVPTPTEARSARGEVAVTIDELDNLTVEPLVAA